MAKSLSQRIADRATKKKPSRNAQNRAAFLAVREDIQQALNDGWPVKTIWETLHEEGKVSFSYQAFRGYVNRLILSSTVKPDDNKRSSNGSQSPAKKTEKPATLAGFTFNPVPNKEALL